MPYKRKETIGDATLICGCCEAAMDEMTENQFELAIVDPPYGIGMDKNRSSQDGKYGYKKYKKTEWDNSYPQQKYFDKLNKVSSNQIIWGANHFNSMIFYDSPCWIVWDKDNGNNDNADAELAYTSFKTAVRKYTKHIASTFKDRIHPTQKPVQLYKWLLNNYAKEGEHILDTHAGSMSSVIACLDMGFKITAYEIDEDYFDAGCCRVEEHVKQLRLF